MGILDRFRSVRASSSGEISKAIGAYRAELLNTEELLTALAEQRRATIEAGDDDALADVKSKIREAEDRIADLRDIIAVAERKREEAATAEDRAEVEGRMREAAAIAGEMLTLLKQAHPMCVALLDKSQRFGELQSQLSELNAYARSKGRTDLLVEWLQPRFHEAVAQWRRDQSLEGSRASLARSVLDAQTRLAHAERQLRQVDAEIAALSVDDKDALTRLKLVRARRLEERNARLEALHAASSEQPRAADNVNGELSVPFGPQLAIPGYTIGGGRHWLEVVFPELRDPPAVVVPAQRRRA